VKLTDDDLLRIVAREFDQAIGLDAEDEIGEARITALNYFKGVMKDVPALANRSKVVSTDVSDAVLTVLPDLMEIFLGGEEIGSFRATSAQDVAAAEQETQVVNHVIMRENDGFALVHDCLHDALVAKVGVAHAWVETEEQVEEYALQAVSVLEIAQLPEGHEITDMQEAGFDPQSGQPLLNVTIRATKQVTHVRVAPVAPEDFAMAPDTKILRDATYCVMRARPRAQDLIAQGFDRELVDRLPGVTWDTEELDLARDTAGERSEPLDISAIDDLRQVVVHVHVVRVDAEGTGQPQVYRIDTDEENSVVLQKQKLNAIPFAIGTPYRQPHRAYGRSLADLLVEIQRIKTVLMRNALDAAYFSLNQRHEVAEETATEDTIGDLLNNQPGMFVRVRRQGTVTPIAPGAMGYSPFDALEYFSTVAESRTGVVRNAQGLNPDTLHDTAKGAQVMMSAAQRRVRMIARVMAETLFKDLYVLVHGLLRQHGSRDLTVQLRGDFVQVDPTSWGNRKDMTIEIGMGGGREHDMMMLELIKRDMSDIVQAQGGPGGPVVTPMQLYALAKKRAERAGLKGADDYYADPQQAMQAAQQQPQQPDPAMQEAQAKLELERAKAQADIQTRRETMQAELAAKRESMSVDAQVAMQKMENERALAQQRLAMEMELAREKADKEMELAIYRANLEAQANAQRTAEDVRLAAFRPGGALDQ
jgi:hypothetical protein